MITIAAIQARVASHFGCTVGSLRTLDYERFSGPPGPGLWIFEGDVSETGEERATFTGAWRRPTATKVSHIAAGTWPAVQVGA